MSKIFIVRHGQDTDNLAGILNSRRDNELTEIGRRQAKDVAEKLRDSDIKVIFTSPLKRACETAQIIRTVLGINDIIIEDGLIEREFGILTGKPVEDIPKYADKIFRGDRVNYFLEVEGAEDFPTLLERARKVLKGIMERYPNENILIVSHSDIGKMLQAAYHGWTWEQELKTPYFDNTDIIELSEKK